MSHTPFILASYLISTVVLLWAGLSPVINKRGLLRQLKNRRARMENAK